MKKNYFYTVIQEELSLLRQGVCSRDASEVSACKRKVQQRHEAMTLRLFREFITPLDRQDLYEISRSVVEAFSPISNGFSASKALCDAVEVLATEPLRLDSGILSRYDRFCAFRDQGGGNREEVLCFRCLDQIFYAMIKAALGNA